MNRDTFSAAGRTTNERAAGPPLDEMGDGQLLARLILQQDPAAFDALVRRHGPMVRSVCRRLLRDDHAAEDACQETFLVLLGKAHRIGRPDRLAGWLYGVALRIARHVKAAAARRWVHERRSATDRVADPLDEVARRDLGATVTAEVNVLPEKYRTTLVLFYWDDKTSAEIARQLGCPLGSMSWRLREGRELLRRRLNRLGDSTAR
jgi:RNA polymerase sigma factor (sigma-70 family)